MTHQWSSLVMNGVPSGDLRRISMGDCKKMVEEGLKSYEREVKDMSVDLFQEVMDHLACADRALSAPHYNDIMLVGRSRVGRRSLVSLIAHLQRFTVFNPALSRKYDNKEWKRDLKQVMQTTGIERHTVFFLEDHHMVKSEILESINSLLNCHDVTGIWTPDELEPLLAPLNKESAASQGRGAVQPRTPFEYFVHQVRSHMRVVLSMDANHPHFLTFCAANPSLSSCCNVMRLDNRSETSIYFVVQRQQTDLPSQNPVAIG